MSSLTAWQAIKLNNDRLAGAFLNFEFKGNTLVSWKARGDLKTFKFKLVRLVDEDTNVYQD